MKNIKIFSYSIGFDVPTVFDAPISIVFYEQSITTTIILKRKRSRRINGNLNFVFIFSSLRHLKRLNPTFCEHAHFIFLSEIGF